MNPDFHTKKNQAMPQAIHHWWTKNPVAVVLAIALTIVLLILVTVITSILRCGSYFADPPSTTITNIPMNHHAMPIDGPTIVGRDEWLAQPTEFPMDKLNQPVPYVIIIHTATNFCETQSACTVLVRMAQAFHVESKHWSDIGYNFLAGGDGSAYVGRGWDYIGTYSSAYNNRSIGIAFIGSFDTISPPVKQIQVVQKLIEDGVKKKFIAEDYKLLGHRQISLTNSPGDALFNIIKTWPHWASEP